jgi:hypothetical protein
MSSGSFPTEGDEHPAAPLVVESGWAGKGYEEGSSDKEAGGLGPRKRQEGSDRPPQ